MIQQSSSHSPLFSFGCLMPQCNSKRPSPSHIPQFCKIDKSHALVALQVVLHGRHECRHKSSPTVPLVGRNKCHALQAFLNLAAIEATFIPWFVSKTKPNLLDGDGTLESANLTGNWRGLKKRPRKESIHARGDSWEVGEPWRRNHREEKQTQKQKL